MHFIMALHVAPCPSIKILSLLVVCKYSGREVDGRIGKVSYESRMTLIKVGCVIQDLKYSAPPPPPQDGIDGEKAFSYMKIPLTQDDFDANQEVDAQIVSLLAGSLLQSVPLIREAL